MSSQRIQPANIDHCRILIVRRIPAYILVDAIQQVCSKWRGLVDIRRSTRVGGHNKMYDLFLVFQNSAYGFDALSLSGQREVILDHIKFQIIPGEVQDMVHFLEKETVTVVASQNLQSDITSWNGDCIEYKLDRELFPNPECNVCFQERGRTDFSTPCLMCNNLICNECMIRNTEVALQDRGSMPVRCCWTTIYPTVLRGVVPDALYKRYMARYEEMHAKSPFYCPVNTCSEFIPARKLKPVNDLIQCPACRENICFKCRQSATQTHACSTAPTAIDEILEKFSYKLCPYCGHGEQKLYGCNRVRCLCGAHWCWGCSKLCHQCCCSGDEDDVLPPSNTDTEMDFELTVDSTSPENSNGGRSPAVPPEHNLDDPRARAWELENLNLGEEPGEDDETIFGCIHVFDPLYKDKLPRYWITAHIPDFWNDTNTSKDNENEEWERHVECMTCHSEAKITTPAGRKAYLHKHDMVQDEAKEILHREVQKLAYWCMACGTVCCRACKHEEEDQKAPD